MYRDNERFGLGKIPLVYHTLVLNSINGIHVVIRAFESAPAFDRTIVRTSANLLWVACQVSVCRALTGARACGSYTVCWGARLTCVPFASFSWHGQA